jgi:hypothetical protein
MEREESLSVAWADFDGLNARLVRYLKTSEEEFCSLIEALNACWNMAENMQKATAQLADTGEESGSQIAAIRESMLEGCAVFRKFMTQLQDAKGQLAGAAQETKQLLASANRLREVLVPLKHIAFHFRLEGSRLSAKDSASVLTDYAEMQHVLNRMKQSGDLQESTLVTILAKVSTATRSVEQASASYAVQAAESEESVERNLALFSAAPRHFLRVRNKADTLGTLAGNGIGQAIKALQGHDSLRQRLQHILDALASIRADQADEPEHALLLQRQQTRSALELIVSTGGQIEQELNRVSDSAQGIAGDDQTQASGDDEMSNFEKAVDRLASLNAEVAGLLGGEVKIGNFVLAQIDPVRELLRANSDELQGLAQAMRSMKLLALNVLVSADKMPSALTIGALGTMTAQAAESVLLLEKELTERFAALGATLQAQIAAIAADVQVVESCRCGLADNRTGEAFRDSRRKQYDEVTRLCQEAVLLKETMEALLRSMKFVDEGRGLLDSLESTIDLLLTLYPKSQKPFDLDAASAGYTMREQHEVHAMVSGAPASGAPPPKPAEGQGYGANVELF